MTADEVIALRKLYLSMSYAPIIPEATVLADRDWLNYVKAMAAQIPKTDTIVWPTEEEAAWAWPNGLLVVLEEPVDLLHTIISTHGGDFREPTPVTPHPESQTVRAMVFSQQLATAAADPEGNRLEDLMGIGVAWIADDPTDIVTGWWVPGLPMHAQRELDISESARFGISLVTALGHRLTKITTPPSWTRAERRRADRELPGLRVLRLSTGESLYSENRDEAHHVEWSKRWLVRGHWRLQACGLRRESRRLIWIDPFVKGPEDKPFDDRPTIWQTGGRPS